jgi:protein Mpv17
VSEPSLTRRESFSTNDTVTFLHFVLFASLVTPPNYAFQNFLSRSFPTKMLSVCQEEVQESDRKVAVRREEKLSITNTAVKFLLDQGLGASVNTVVFIAVMGMFKGLSTADIVANVRKLFSLPRTANLGTS